MGWFNHQLDCHDTVHGWNPAPPGMYETIIYIYINNGILYISTGAGFLPSTVWMTTRSPFFQDLQSPLKPFTHSLRRRFIPQVSCQAFEEFQRHGRRHVKHLGMKLPCPTTHPVHGTGFLLYQLIARFYHRPKGIHHFWTLARTFRVLLFLKEKIFQSTTWDERFKKFVFKLFFSYLNIIPIGSMGLVY